MFHRIVLAVDLADPASGPKGLAQALELATQSGGDLRLVNVQPLLPATFMEYVPADFDEEQEKRSRDALAEIAAKLALPKERVTTAALSGGVYLELLRDAEAWGADLIVVGFAPAGDVRLSARLQRQNDRPPRAMFGAGGARVISA